MYMYISQQHTGAFYYLLGNLSPRFRSKIHNIQLLLLAKYSSVAEYGIDRILNSIVEDVRILESVCVYMYMHAYNACISVLHVCTKTRVYMCVANAYL